MLNLAIKIVNGSATEATNIGSKMWLSKPQSFSKINMNYSINDYKFGAREKYLMYCRKLSNDILK